MTCLNRLRTTGDCGRDWDATGDRSRLDGERRRLDHRTSAVLVRAFVRWDGGRKSARPRAAESTPRAHANDACWNASAFATPAPSTAIGRAPQSVAELGRVIPATPTLALGATGRRPVGDDGGGEGGSSYAAAAAAASRALRAPRALACANEKADGRTDRALIASCAARGLGRGPGPHARASGSPAASASSRKLGRTAAETTGSWHT